MGKGLRQGDPLAPFLFTITIVAEGLNGLVRLAVQQGKFAPYRLKDDQSLEIPILQFADDTLFLGEASMQNVILMKCVLRCFELASGLKVNFGKSKLAGISVNDRFLSRVAAGLNCCRMDVPFVYLGLPNGGNPRRLRFWDPIINKMRLKLSSWRQKFLYFGGKLCLINSGSFGPTPLFHFLFQDVGWSNIKGGANYEIFSLGWQGGRRKEDRLC